MNENISIQLINRIINKLSGVKPFIKMVEFDNYGQESFMMYENNTEIRYECSSISVSVKEMEYNLDNYNLVIYLLDQLMLNLTMNVETKNYYFINDTIEEDMIDVMNKTEKVTWFMTYETHLELITMLDPEEKIVNWTDFNINGRKIHTIESSFPKSLIFGCEYPIIINPKQLKVISIDNIDSAVIQIPFFYVKDFYAMRLISDEHKKKLFLRHKKIKKLKNIDIF